MPYKENGWVVKQVDIKNGIDVLTWDYQTYFALLWAADSISEIGIIAMIPCTDYALSGARHFATKDNNGTTENSQKLVAKTKEIIDFLNYTV